MADITVEEIVKIGLAILGIVLLLYLSVSLYGIFTFEKEVNQAHSSMDRIETNIQKIINKEITESEFFIEGPDRWELVLFPKPTNSEKPGNCENNCLCLCKTPKVDVCEESGVCREFTEKIKTDKEFFAIDKGVLSLKISLENNEIVVRQV